MGNFPSKKKNKLCKKDVRILTEKIRLLREEINGMMHEREKESRAYEREVMVFAFKEAEWKQERKKLKEEVKTLGKNLEEKEEKIREMKDGLVNEKDDEVEWQLLGTSFLMGRMKEERARRDEAVEKWKQLYLAIKTELDELIQRTHGALFLCSLFTFDSIKITLLLIKSCCLFMKEMDCIGEQRMKT